MTIDHAMIYRCGKNCLAVLTHPDGRKHYVEFTAEKSVSFRKCVERALTKLHADAVMGCNATYEGAFVAELPVRDLMQELEDSLSMSRAVQS